MEVTIEKALELAVNAHSIGKLEEAEYFYKIVLQKHPTHQFTLKVLGDIFKQTGRVHEALIARQKTVELDPSDFEAYYNLANTLNELGRLEEAEKNYRKAIKLKPEFVLAHCNMGVVLKGSGKLKEAEDSFRKVISLDSNFTDAYTNLGNTLTELNKLEEAEVEYKKSLSLNPDSAETHNSLGITLQELGKLKKAADSFKKAIDLEPSFTSAILNLSIVHDYMNNLDEAIIELKNIVKINSPKDPLKAKINLAIFNFLKNDFLISKKYLVESSEIEEMLDNEFLSYKIYWRYLLNLLNWHDNKPINQIDCLTNKKLFVIGESHSLVSHQLKIKISENYFVCHSLLIQGCKQWDLGSPKINKFKIKFKKLFSSIPKSSLVLISIGEIDCRLDSGIIKFKKKNPNKNISKIIFKVVKRYLNYISKINLHIKHKVIIQGVPCPNIEIKNIEDKEIKMLVNVIKQFNIILREKSYEMGFTFLDLYKLTDRGDGFSNKVWHIDQYHLSPKAMLKVWNNYTS